MYIHSHVHAVARNAALEQQLAGAQTARAYVEEAVASLTAQVHLCVCMLIYMHMRMCVCRYIYMHVHMYVCMHIYMHMHMCV